MELRSTAEPLACAYCGLPKRGHFQQWVHPHGWHTYKQPSKALIHLRIMARRQEKERAAMPPSTQVQDQPQPQPESHHRKSVLTLLQIALSIANEKSWTVQQQSDEDGEAVYRLYDENLAYLGEVGWDDLEEDWKAIVDGD